MRFLSDRHDGVCFGCILYARHFHNFELAHHFLLPYSTTGKKAADFYEQVPVIIRELLHRLNDDSTVVLTANNKALAALTSCVPAEELVTHLQFIRNLIASMVSDARYRKGGVGDGLFFLPGFNMKKGKQPDDMVWPESIRSELDDTIFNDLRSRSTRLYT